jgi:beta-phosphoglucomutase family hydrolase
VDEQQKVEFSQQRSVVISPNKFDAVLFDMDGVVTRTAAVHFAAWKKIFDEFLTQSKANKNAPFSEQDYLDYVDGKPREDGVRSFIEGRGIKLPEGSAADQSGFESIASVARMKDEEFMRLIHTNGVEPYETTVALIRALKAAGMATALVTASKNGEEILRVTHLKHLFDATVTGVDAEKLKLHGKPAPDVFLEAARRLSVQANRAVVVEDAEAGVESGHNGHFGLVIGVARHKNRESLRQHGADVAVTDLSEVVVSNLPEEHSLGTALADMDVTEANWIVSYDQFVPEQEGRRESLCALGNGKFCTRGAAAEAQADAVHYPGTYVAGGYNSAWLEVGDQRFDSEELVNMPNWLCLSFRIGEGDWFDLSSLEILSYSQRLNLRQGILYRDVAFRDSEGRETQLSERRFVHMRYSHLAGIEVVLSAINWSGKLTIRTALDGTVVNSGEQVDPKFRAVKHLNTIDRSADGDLLFLKVRTTDSELVVAEAARTVISIDGNPVIDEQRTNIVEPEYVAQDIVLSISESQSVSVQKTVSLYTSRDRGIYEPGATAKDAVDDAFEFEILISRQVQIWRILWHEFDLFVETTEEHSKLIPSLLLHLNSFHTLQTASPHTVDLDTSVPARGWTGEGYQGHVFWDDLFVFPFVNLRFPNISAALLKYRYRRLPEARKIARKYGASGACFPWQSAGDGRERTPDFWWMPSKQKWIRDYTHLEIHVNGAIAFNLWQYYQVSMDEQFMYSYGAEMLMEIARFFATIAKYNPDRERYEIHGVIGPDEFHNGYPNFEKPGVNNNAYTNIMAVWTLCRALELVEKLPADRLDFLRTRLSIADEELALWDDVSRKMFVPMMPDGVIAQFEGYEKLQEFPRQSDGKIDPAVLQQALDENDGYLNQYKMSKQADVLMLTYVFSPDEMKELCERLGHTYKAENIAANCRYYIPRTANASTLSRVAHVWALSRINRLLAAKLIPYCRSQSDDDGEEPSKQLFYEALGSDYYDVAARGTARNGIHMGAMAGTVDIVQRCLTGIVMRDDVLWLDPALPKPLLRLSFKIRYRDQSLSFDIDHEHLKVSARHSSAKPIKIGFQKQVYELNAGESKIFQLEAGEVERNGRPHGMAVAKLEASDAR